MSRPRIVAVLPGPAALNLKLKRQTEEGADENDEAHNDHVVEGRINNDRPYNVARNKKFESQKNSPSHILAAKAISVQRAPLLVEYKPNGRKRRSKDHHGDASSVHGGAYQIHDLSEPCHDREVMLSVRNGHKSKRKAGLRKRADRMAPLNTEARVHGVRGSEGVARMCRVIWRGR